MAQTADQTKHHAEPRPGRSTFRGREVDANTVGAYLRQIGAFCLLTQDQEREIARRMRVHQAEMARILLGHRWILRRVNPDLSEAELAELRNRLEALAAFRQQLASIGHQGHEEPALLEQEEESLERLQEVFRELDLDDARLDRFIDYLRASRTGVSRRRGAPRTGGTGAGMDRGKAAWTGRPGMAGQGEGLPEGAGEQPREDLARMLHARQALHAARTAFTEANLRLVVSVARRYVHLGLPLPDLIQEGNLGLIKAIDRFDYRRGNKFSTYGIWWIRQYILRALQKNALADRTPATQAASAFVPEVAGVLPQTPAAAGQQSANGEQVERVREPRPGRAFHFIRGIRLASLEAPVGEGLYALCDLIPDESAVSPEEAIVQRVRAEKAQQALETLSPREAEILRRRFGIGDGREETLRELSRTFGVTRERIRQIETMALQKLRKADQAGRLAGYLG
jgi:RNA polymerase sigma factor (sigma-70 family)